MTETLSYNQQGCGASVRRNSSFLNLIKGSMSNEKKKKVSVPKPDTKAASPGTVTISEISPLLMKKLDKDLQIRLAFSGLKLDPEWVFKVFGICCEEMYVRTSLKSLELTQDQEKRREILDDIRYYGYKVSD